MMRRGRGSETAIVRKIVCYATDPWKDNIAHGKWANHYQGEQTSRPQLSFLGTIVLLFREVVHARSKASMLQSNKTYFCDQY